jgi:hypothetical protein
MFGCFIEVNGIKHIRFCLYEKQAMKELSRVMTKPKICAVWSGSMLFAFSFPTCNRVCRLTAWILIRLRECAGWSGSMLVANPLCWFCRDVAQFFFCLSCVVFVFFVVFFPSSEGIVIFSFVKVFVIFYKRLHNLLKHWFKQSFSCVFVYIANVKVVNRNSWFITAPPSPLFILLPFNLTSLVF